MTEQTKLPLPADIIAWIEAQGPGSLQQLERHVARREAWLTAVAGPDGAVTEGFLRLERKPSHSSSISLEREVRICQALAGSGVPVPRVYAWEPQRRLALFERVAGSAAIDKLEDHRQQRAVMEDFIDAVARLHQLQPEGLGLDDVLGSPELSPRECALGDLDAQLAGFKAFLADYRDPLLIYAVQWLQRFAPDSVQRVCLVQGDTGPVNFMFKGDRVTALVDWEWGHWGDPMEDLGNICVREFWNPCGGLEGLFHRYEQKSGLSYRRDAALYYRVQQNTRGMIPIHATCQSRGMRESLAWYLAYRYIGDRSTCEALAAAMAVVVERPELPDDTAESEPLVDAIYARSRYEVDIDYALVLDPPLRAHEQALLPLP